VFISTAVLIAKCAEQQVALLAELEAEEEEEIRLLERQLAARAQVRDG
jgi:hypothetical protein